MTMGTNPIAILPGVVAELGRVFKLLLRNSRAESAKRSRINGCLHDKERKREMDYLPQLFDFFLIFFRPGPVQGTTPGIGAGMGSRSLSLPSIWNQNPRLRAAIRENGMCA
jgi:hypothetical protein